MHVFLHKKNRIAKMNTNNLKFQQIIKTKKIKKTDFGGAVNLNLGKIFDKSIFNKRLRRKL